MDAPSLDVWIEAQNPPILQEIVAVEADGVIPSIESAEAELKSGKMRLNAIRDTAFAYGAQTGLAWRYQRLLDFTKSQEGTLDRIANFSPFIVDERMLLPSITEVRDRYDVSPSGQEVRTVEIQYQIDEPPKAISQPPTWRQYLWREFPYPELPHPALLPDSSDEEEIWKKAVVRGWKSGLEHAQLSWENNLNEMVQDIRGRITYRILENRGVVNAPMMTKGIPEMTQAEGGRILNAGDTVYSITVPVTFASQNQWGALWTKSNDEEPILQPLRKLQQSPSEFVGEPVFSKPEGQ
jgi:defect-in-organelle-trafficking protein DotC